MWHLVTSAWPTEKKCICFIVIFRCCKSEKVIYFHLKSIFFFSSSFRHVIPHLSSSLLVIQAAHGSPDAELKPLAVHLAGGKATHRRRRAHHHAQYQVRHQVRRLSLKVRVWKKSKRTSNAVLVESLRLFVCCLPPVCSSETPQNASC